MMSRIADGSCHSLDKSMSQGNTIIVACFGLRGTMSRGCKNIVSCGLSIALACTMSTLIAFAGNGAFEVFDWRFRDKGLGIGNERPELGIILTKYTDKEYKSYLLKVDALEKHGFKVNYDPETWILRFTNVNQARVAFEAYSHSDMAGMSRFLGELWEKYPDIIEHVAPPSAPLKVESLGLTYMGRMIWINKRWGISRWHDDVMYEGKFEFMEHYSFNPRTNSFEYSSDSDWKPMSAQANEDLVNRILRIVPEDFIFYTQEDYEAEYRNDPLKGGGGPAAFGPLAPVSDAVKKAAERLQQMSQPPTFDGPRKK